jgi:molybdate transport system regulatory protein
LDSDDAGDVLRKEGRRCFFFEKEKQKTFAVWARAKEQKFFGSFFKKELLPQENHPMPKLRHPDHTGLHLRVVLDGGVAVGPGRAELLEHIRDLGSIAAAGRAMGMSYRRAWTLVDATAREFGAPVVEAAPGGARGGSASLTELGARILGLYRSIEAKAAQAAAPELSALCALARPAGRSDDSASA